MPRKTKFETENIPKLVRRMRKESTNTDPVIDGEERALNNFMRRLGVECSTHTRPALAKLIVEFLRHRKRH